MTVAELDKHYRWSDEVVINTAKKYAKRVMKGDPNTPVATLRRRLLAQKLKELAAKEKAAPTKAAMNVQAGEATWKQWMGLRGVPVISVSSSCLFSFERWRERARRRADWFDASFLPFPSFLPFHRNGLRPLILSRLPESGE